MPTYSNTPLNMTSVPRTPPPHDCWPPPLSVTRSVSFIIILCDLLNYRIPLSNHSWVSLSFENWLFQLFCHYCLGRCSVIDKDLRGVKGCCYCKWLGLRESFSTGDSSSWERHDLEAFEDCSWTIKVLILINYLIDWDWLRIIGCRRLIIACHRMPTIETVLRSHKTRISLGIGIIGKAWIIIIHQWLNRDAVHLSNLF